MIRITELKLPLSAVPVEARRASDAPTETDADRAPAPHPIEALKALAAQALNLAPADITTLQVFKRSFGGKPCLCPRFHEIFPLRQLQPGTTQLTN